ncbi:hypothetical protein CYLTODRAFT_422579 [Cylindrobasidium torrendii FP15055 ss-10]|nr:hypothetical protein CYLTODRAFT_422579 [Cylindrobasidium torrendii FP15055 ss-10]
MDESEESLPTVFRCGQCGSEGFNRRGLMVHQRIHKAPGVKAFVCPYKGCDFAGGQEGNIQSHDRRHTGERPYPCAYPGCEYVARHNSALKRHMKRHDRPGYNHAQDRGRHYQSRDIRLGERHGPWVETAEDLLMKAPPLVVHHHNTRRKPSGEVPNQSPFPMGQLAFPVSAPVKPELKYPPLDVLKPATAASNVSTSPRAPPRLKSEPVATCKLPFSCAYRDCDGSFFTLSELLDHKEAEHVSKLAFGCPFALCGFGAANAERVKDHVLEAHV